MILLFVGSSINNSNISAQTTEQLIVQLALSEFHQNFDVAQRMNAVAENGTQYSDYEVSFIEVHDEWARIHILSTPETEFTSSGVHNWPDFQGGVAHEENGIWTIYFEGTTEFDELKNDLPFWLSFLNVPQNQPQTIVSVPGLPWTMGETWRYTGGFHAGWALDFAPLQKDGQGVQGNVHALEGGEIVSRPTNEEGGQSCIYVKRGDGLIMMYQHIESSDLDRFSVGNKIAYGDYLGKTNYPSRDCSAPGNSAHHVHIEFRWAGSGSQGNSFNPTGSTMNGWVIASTNQLTKGGISVTAAQGSPRTNEVYHDGCPSADEYGWLDKAFLYPTRGCEGTGTIIREEDGKVVLTGIPGVDNTSASLFAPNGYAVKLWDSPEGQYTCVDGSLWDMSKDYFVGTSNKMYQAVSAIQIVSGTCADLSGDPNCAQHQFTGSDDPTGLRKSTNMCEAAQEPPPNTLPLPPGPQAGSGGGVKLYQYPNYEGQLLYTFNEGFSNEPNAEGYSLQIPDGWSVITYRDDNGQGISRCWSESVPNLQDHEDWQTKIQSISIFKDRNVCPADPPSPTLTPHVQFYGNNDYQNPNRNYNMGFHDRQFFYANSMQIKAGSSVVLYRLDNRQSVNEAFCFNSNIPNLNAAGWPYEIVGLEVFDADLCQDRLIPTHDYVVYTGEGMQVSNCGGHGPTVAADLTNWCGDWNDRISSIRIKQGWSIKVWDNVNFQGGNKCFSSSRTTMRNDAFSDGLSIAVYPPEHGDRDSRISSFAVFENEHCDGSPTMPESAWGFANDDGSLALGSFVMSAEANNDQSITVSWEATTDSTANGYHIYEHMDNDSYELVSTINSRFTTSATFNSLPCGTDFHYLVKAFNQWGDSATPNLVAVSTPSCFVEAVEGPTPFPPTNLQLSNIGATSVMATWSDNSQIEHNYRAIVTGSDDSWHNIHIPANTTSKVITGLACEVEYDVRIRVERVVDNVVYGDYTDFEYFTTLPCGQSQSTTVYLPIVTTPAVPEGPTPNAPTNLRLIDSSESTLYVSWNDNSEIEQTFEIWHQVIGGSWQNPSVPANTTSHTISGLACETDYFVVVRAVRWENSFEYYVDSNVLQATTGSCGEGGVPNAPTNVRALDTTQTSITFGWDDNSEIETNYRLQIGKRDASNAYDEYLPANTTSQLVTGLDCGEEYQANVQVRPINPSASWTETLYVHTDWCGPESDFPRRPTQFHISSETQTSITYAWEDNSSHETYYYMNWFETSQGGPVNAIGLPANSTSGTISELACGTRYTALVVALIDGSSYASFWMWHDTAPCS